MAIYSPGNHKREEEEEHNTSSSPSLAASTVDWVKDVNVFVPATFVTFWQLTLEYSLGWLAIVIWRPDEDALDNAKAKCREDCVHHGRHCCHCSLGKMFYLQAWGFSYRGGAEGSTDNVRRNLDRCFKKYWMRWLTMAPVPGTTTAPVPAPVPGTTAAPPANKGF